MKTSPKIALLSGLFAAGLCLNVIPSNAQKEKTKTKTKVKTEKETTANSNDGFQKLTSGLEYKIPRHGTGTRKPEIGDHVEINIYIHDKDSVLFDSRKMNNNQPVPLPIAAAKFKGDVMEGFTLMVVGDSAVFRLPVDSFKKTGAQLPPWAKDGDYIEYNVNLVSVRSEEEEKKYQAEKAEVQKGIDDKILQDYFTKNNIKPMKTASGLYYTISAPGTGETIKTGTTASVNYTGMFLDGRKFDSNTDSAFHHVQPFTLEVGKGRVIKGWDEGLQLLRKGAKATFYIPSPLAYGSMERPQIPANSILVFDVEITDVQDPSKQNETDDKLIREYLTKNKINATKTASGLYYVITQKGLGPTAKPGKKVTMNYTGKTLDGKIFDSNVDPSKGHVQPFTFALGQGQVIKGWDEGVQLLNMGAKATFFIPSALAYGSQGAGGAIAPNTVLMFDVELVSIDK
jgi:FKBP-type peptidyl-prolyl cis-trans isomerase FkpA